MALEIERKFRVKAEFFAMVKHSPEKFAPCAISQAYVADGKTFLVRVRQKGEKAYLTIKGRTTGVTRREYEYEIPPADAAEIIAALKADGAAIVEKTRYFAEYAGKVWEVDIFAGANEGLAVAEIELASEGEEFTRPGWLGEEVSDDPRYYNANLAKFPYSQWQK